MKTEKTISQIMNEWLAAERNICTARGSFTAADFRRMQGVLNETLSDFIIFNNAGGKTFEIWTKADLKRGSIQGVVDWVTESYGRHGIYMYKIDGEEFIVNPIPKGVPLY